MGTVLEDASIRVRIDLSGVTKEDLEKVGAAQETIRERTDREKEEGARSAAFAVPGRSRAVGEVAGLGLGIQRGLDRAGGFGQAVQQVLGIALLVERIGMPAIRGAIEGLFGGKNVPETGQALASRLFSRPFSTLAGLAADAVSPTSQVLDQILARLGAVEKKVEEARTLITALGKTADDAMELGKGQALLGFDMDPEFVRNFLAADLKWNWAMDQLHHRADKKVAETQVAGLLRMMTRGNLGF